MIFLRDFIAVCFSFSVETLIPGLPIEITPRTRTKVLLTLTPVLGLNLGLHFRVYTLVQVSYIYGDTVLEKDGLGFVFLGFSWLPHPESRPQALILI